MTTPEIKIKDFKKNKMFGFPTNILNEVDRRIQKGHKADMIRQYVAQAYRGELAIPNRKTIAVYIKWRQQHIVVRQGIAIRVQQTENELRAMLEKLNVAGTDLGNRKVVIEKLLSFILVRIEVLTHLQESIADPKIEQTILGYVIEARVLTETLKKFEGKSHGR